MLDSDRLGRPRSKLNIPRRSSQQEREYYFERYDRWRGASHQAFWGEVPRLGLIQADTSGFLRALSSFLVKHLSLASHNSWVFWPSCIAPYSSLNPPLGLSSGVAVESIATTSCQGMLHSPITQITTSPDRVDDLVGQEKKNGEGKKKKYEDKS